MNSGNILVGIRKWQSRRELDPWSISYAILFSSGSHGTNFLQLCPICEVQSTHEG